METKKTLRRIKKYLMDEKIHKKKFNHKFIKIEIPTISDKVLLYDDIDDKLPLCIDFSNLNKVVVKDICNRFADRGIIEDYLNEMISYVGLSYLTDKNYIVNSVLYRIIKIFAKELKSSTILLQLEVSE